MLSVSTPHVGEGYLFGGEDLDFPRWEEGRVVTGDHGQEVDGDLFCLGRSGRLVKRSATFVDLDEVDLVLRDQQDLVAFTVATLEGELVTLVEASSRGLDGVRDLLATQVAPDVVPDALVAVTALPRLGNGKPDQAAALRLAERARRGEGGLSNFG
jgi:acyl-CoA synthetase (AMP-forming)/AMP-acid ligase II